MNSLYGVMGYSKFRLYDEEMGAGVTSTGRGVINHTKSKSNDLGYEVVYGDTDSVLLDISDVEYKDVDLDRLSDEHDECPPGVTDEIREAHPEMDEDELRKMVAAVGKSFEIQEVINNAYDEYAASELNAEKHYFLLEAEKLYRRFFQAGKKKRYAGDIVWKEGNHVSYTDITGFEYQRSDTPPVVANMQKGLIERIVKGEDKDEIRDFVHDSIQEYREGEHDLEEIGIPGGIGKGLYEYDSASAHVRGARYANAVLGTHFTMGSKPKRVYLDRVDPQFFRDLQQEIQKEDGELDLTPRQRQALQEFRRQQDVICFNYSQQVPDEFEVDLDEMLERSVQGTIERVLEPLGISWDEVKAGQTQQGLSSYM